MDQDQSTPMATTLEWDTNGELCSEDLEILLERLTAEKVNTQQN